jgi:hypothetical protein
MQSTHHRRAHWAWRWFGGGPKGPPSAPPAIPPIIINPFSYQTPAPAIDPRITPIGPPVTPVYRPDIRFTGLALQ